MTPPVPSPVTATMSSGFALGVPFGHLLCSKQKCRKSQWATTKEILQSVAWLWHGGHIVKGDSLTSAEGQFLRSYISLRLYISLYISLLLYKTWHKPCSIAKSSFLVFSKKGAQSSHATVQSEQIHQTHVNLIKQRLTARNPPQQQCKDSHIRYRHCKSRSNTIWSICGLNIKGCLVVGCITSRLGYHCSFRNNWQVFFPHDQLQLVISWLLYALFA